MFNEGFPKARNIANWIKQIFAQFNVDTPIYLYIFSKVIKYFLFRPGLTATVRRSSTMKCWIWNLWWRILMRLQLRVTLVKLKLSTPLQRKLSARTNQNLEVNYIVEKWSWAEEKSEMLPVWWMFIRLFHLNHLHHF